MQGIHVKFWLQCQFKVTKSVYISVLIYSNILLVYKTSLVLYIQLEDC